MKPMQPSGFRRAKIEVTAVVETDLPIDKDGNLILPDGTHLCPSLSFLHENSGGIVNWLDASELFERNVSVVSENKTLEVFGAKQLPAVLNRRQVEVIYANAVSAYQNSRDGQDAVLEWSEAYNFAHEHCEGCGAETPVIKEDNSEAFCLVCGQVL